MRTLSFIIMGLFFNLFSFAQPKGKPIVIPEEKFSVFALSSEGKPVTVLLNSALKEFKHKKTYGWTCSLVISFKDMTEDGVPTNEEYNYVIDYVETLDKDIKGRTSDPNALLLARIIWNGTCEVIWQIKDPEPVHQYLGDIIRSNSYPRELDYRIEYDKKWKKISFYQKLAKKALK